MPSTNETVSDFELSFLLKNYAKMPHTLGRVCLFILFVPLKTEKNKQGEKQATVLLVSSAWFLSAQLKVSH